MKSLFTCAVEDKSSSVAFQSINVDHKWLFHAPTRSSTSESQINYVLYLA